MAVDFNIEVRKKQLESLDQYLNFSKSKVQSLLEKLGWSSKTLLEDREPIMINCSINPSHRIPFKTAEEHMKNCSVRICGYDKDDKFLSEPSDETSASTIKLDYQKKVEILSHARWCNPHFQPAWNGVDPDPMTSNRITSTYSADERLAMYDFCAANTQKPPDPPEFNVYLDDKPDEGKELTFEEKLARERDAKRRRIKYKSVHTNRKSHTEIIKEVIENQMEMFTDWLSSKQDVEKNCSRKKEEIERPNSSTSKHSTHSGDSRKKIEPNHRSEPRNGSVDRRNSHRKRDRRYRDESNDRRRYQRRERSSSRHRSRSTHRRNRSRDRRDDRRRR